MSSTKRSLIWTYLLSLSIIILPTAYLQAQSTMTTRDLGTINAKMHGAGIIAFQSTKYIGSPFLTKFQHGYIIMKSGAKSQPLLLRYNTRTNNVQYVKNKKDIYKIPAKKINAFVIKTSDGNITFKNGFKTEQDNINQNTLLWVIYNGNNRLLAHFSSTLMKNIATYGTATKKSKFMSHTAYFLQTPDGTFHEVKLKRKDILDVLSNHKKGVKKYAKKHHLSFEKTSDLKKILAYYDSINSNSGS